MALAGRDGIRHTVRWQTPSLGVEITIDTRHTTRTDFMIEANSRGGVVEGIDRLIEKLIEARENVRKDVAA
jgi:hypothetical protein